MDPVSKIFVLFFKIILCLFNFGHYILLNIFPKIATRNNHQESLQSFLDRDRYIYILLGLIEGPAISLEENQIQAPSPHPPYP